MSSRDIEIHHATWRGIGIEIRFERNWLGSPPSEYHPSHLEVCAVMPERAPLPITETGYRSHFLHPDPLDEAGGPVAFVLAWLDAAAGDKSWQEREAAARSSCCSKTKGPRVNAVPSLPYRVRPGAAETAPADRRGCSFTRGRTPAAPRGRHNMP